jgi:hypothetical protein
LFTPQITPSIEGLNTIVSSNKNRTIFNLPQSMTEKVINHAEKKGKSATKGFYKIASNEEGHITETDLVTWSDLSSLGATHRDEFSAELAKFSY